jgi:hypothetical protein
MAEANSQIKKPSAEKSWRMVKTPITVFAVLVNFMADFSVKIGVRA